MMVSLINSEEIFLNDLKKEFIEQLIQDITVLNNSIESKTPANIAKIAHDIKGTIGIFGYDEGTELALQLQLAAEGAKWDKIQAIYDSFLIYLRAQKLIDQSVC